MFVALSLNSVTISEDNILEFDPVTYKSIFFSLDSPSTTSTNDITSVSSEFAKTCLPSLRLGLIIEYTFCISSINT